MSAFLYTSVVADYMSVATGEYCTVYIYIYIRNRTYLIIIQMHCTRSPQHTEMLDSCNITLQISSLHPQPAIEQVMCDALQSKSKKTDEKKTDKGNKMTMRTEVLARLYIKACVFVS